MPKSPDAGISPATAEQFNRQKQAIELELQNKIDRVIEMKDKLLSELAQQFMGGEITNEKLKSETAELNARYKLLIEALKSGVSIEITQLLSAHLAIARNL
jgi:hypothetical protein